MRPRGVSVWVALGVVALSGCGGSGHSSSTTKTTSTPAASATTTSASTSTSSGIAGRLLTSSEVPTGFTASQPVIATGVDQWVAESQTPSGQVASETRRLRGLGFVAAARDDLTGVGGDGLSLAEQFRSTAGARSELAADLSTFKSNSGSAAATFPVPGIPKAIGFGGSGPGGGVNVAFADGDYYYLVGEAVTATSANKRAVIDAAQKLYRRVHA